MSQRTSSFCSICWQRTSIKTWKAPSDPREVLSLVSTYKPDILLLDLMMPHLDGIEVMDQIKAHFGRLANCDVMILTADISQESKRRALRKGAKDFITKPFDVLELLLRIENLLETRHLRMQLQSQNATLELRVQERTASLQVAQDGLQQYAVQLEDANSGNAGAARACR